MAPLARSEMHALKLYSDGEVWRHMELWRLDVGIAAWKYGGLDACCRRSDTELLMYGAQEACRHGGLEVLEALKTMDRS